MTDTDFMREAIAAARAGIAAGQTPFGCAITSGGRVVVAAHNTVHRDCDPTAHAEVNALRAAARQLARIDLSDCDLYTTCEPCPMCLSAIHWAKVRHIYYGATIADAAAAGFRELQLPAEELAGTGGSHLTFTAGVCSDECRALFGEWQSAGLSQPY